jgi:hypothetical protein
VAPSSLQTPALLAQSATPTNGTLHIPRNLGLAERQEIMGTRMLGLVQGHRRSQGALDRYRTHRKRPISLPPVQVVPGRHFWVRRVGGVLFSRYYCHVAPIKIGLEGLVKKEYMDILDEE